MRVGMLKGINFNSGLNIYGIELDNNLIIYSSSIIYGTVIFSDRDCAKIVVF